MPRRASVTQMPPVDGPEGLEQAVRAAIEHMHWLAPSDQAAVELALKYAARIDEALDTADGQEVTKALYLGPHLLNTLRALGGAPAERAALGGEEKVRGRLAELRSARK